MKNPRLLLPLALFAAALATPSSSLAATDVGMVAAQGATMSDCTANTGHVTDATPGANPYAAPTAGVITEWRFRAEANPGTVALQVLAADPNNTSTYTPLAEAQPAVLVANQLNEVKTRISIAAGQLIGLRAVTFSHGCYATATGFTNHGSAAPAPLPGGGPAMYGFGSGGNATNVAATIEADADGDGFGDETQDGCPGNAGRSDDCVAPSVKIDSGPAKKTKKAKAKFIFSSDDKDAKFECSLDGKKFSSCTSPLKVKVKKKKAKHTLSVRAVDKNGNKSDEADYGWKVKPKKKVKG